MGKIITAFAIVGAIVNLSFALVNYMKINKLYKNPNDPNAQKALSDIRQFAIITVIIFLAVALSDIVAAFTKDKKQTA
jgi:uncharacterized membrane protein